MHSQPPVPRHSPNSASSSKSDTKDIEDDEPDQEEEEDEDYEDQDVDQQQSPRPPKPHLSHWAELDISVIIALISPLGHWLTGGDHLKNLFLIVFLILYLHQLIQVPWELYQSSLPRKAALPSIRRSTSPSPSRSQESKRAVELAQTSLDSQQIYYLFLTMISPFLGATFLRFVLDKLGGAAEMSWFSTTLFVLATGIRPWGHLISRLRKQTHDLHDTVHYHHPHDDSVYAAQQTITTLQTRIEKLEGTITQMQARDKKQIDIEGMYDDLSGGLDDIESMLRRVQRKGEVARANQDAKMLALERCIKVLMEERRNAYHLPRITNGSGIRHWLDVVWNLARPANQQSYFPQIAANGGPKHIKRERSQSSLETIAEVDDNDDDGEAPVSPLSPRSPQSITPPLSPNTIKRNRQLPPLLDKLSGEANTAAHRRRKDFSLGDLLSLAVTVPVRVIVWSLMIPQRVLFWWTRPVKRRH